METILNYINAYSPYILIGLSFLVLLLFILLVVALYKISSNKKRFDSFMGARSDKHNIEAMLLEYLELSEKIDMKYTDLVDEISTLDRRLKKCTQKTGMVRYNPFNEVGGDLCFALALLDEYNDGYIINSIYSREGCYCYCKKITDGKSPEHKLSIEEDEALEIALNSGVKVNIGGKF